MRVAYIRWIDATKSVDEIPYEEVGRLIEIEAVGFVLIDTEESIGLGMEYTEPGSPARMTIAIPKKLITEFREIDIDENTKKRRGNKHVPQVRGKRPGAASGRQGHLR